MNCKKTIGWIVMVFLSWIAQSLHGQPATMTNSIGIEFILIHPGKMIVGKFQPPYPVPADTVKGATRPIVMWMGEGKAYGEKEFTLAKELALQSATPGFEVTIPRAFYLGKFEVTQAQWQKVMGKNPSVFKGDAHPVDNISWDDAQEFVSRLNKLEGKNIYRLPSEFEWEYAARAGREGDIPWKETNATAQLGGMTTQPVGGKQPNAWGLYDMLGNVWEWVQDPYNEKIFADPIPPEKGKVHVLKGASFVGDVKNATYLTHAGGPGNGWDVGFRVLMEIE